MLTSFLPSWQAEATVFKGCSLTLAPFETFTAKEVTQNSSW